MKKLLIAIVVCLSVFSVVNVKAADVTRPVAPSLFNAGEVGLTLSSGVSVNPKDSVRTVPGPVVDDFIERKYCPSENTPEQVVRSKGHRTVNFTVGGFWFPTKLVGVEANLPIFNEENGVHVDEVQAGLLLRLPLFEKCPVLRHVAPYAGLGTVLNWQEGNTWSYVAKGGLSVRVVKHVELFGEYQYRNVDFHWSQGSRVVQAGLKFPF